MTLYRIAAVMGVLLCSALILPAQERTLGTWKVFNPNRSTIALCDAGDKVYNASGKGLFSYEKSSGGIQFYDKNTGLSDVNIRTMGYDPDTKTLVIAYNNSNLDIIENGTDIYNISDFKLENASGSVTINHIAFYNGRCYVSSTIGISEINLARKEIMNTYIIGNGGAQVNVYASSADGNKIYAATAQGLKYASLNSTNLQNFNAWQTFDTTQGLRKIPFSQVAAYNGKVYAASIGVGYRPDTLFQYSNNVWQPLYFSANDSVINLNVWGNTLYFCTWNNDSTTGKNGQINSSGVLSAQTAVGHVRPTGWFFSDGHSWEGDLWGGLLRNNQQGYIENIIPDGPFTADAFSLNVTADGELIVCGGGVDGSWGSLYNSSGFYKYKNDTWSNINQYTHPALSGVLDLLSSATINNKTYVGSFRKGLAVYDNASGELTVFDRTNSPIEPNMGDLVRDAVSAVQSDKNRILWLGNAGATKPIKALRPDGSWLEFSLPFNIALIKKIMIDQNNQFWMPVRRSGEGLMVWSYKGTLENTSDDFARILTSGDGMGGLPDAICYCVAEDKEGNIWVGTNSGIGVFYCPGSVLTSNGCDADQIKVERDGYIGYLFGTESVRAIAVDAANRKWIGTTNGVWLISADGKDELLKFNTDNSPLPNNQITDIAIDDKTGEVFIATLGGLVSYQGDAMGLCSDCDGALVYPNPVKPGYDGPIAIKGLVEDAYVKITDITGTLVYQGKANGTQMIWNGRGYKGERAKSGVYLVFSSTDLGKEKQVAKILIAN